MISDQGKDDLVLATELVSSCVLCGNNSNRILLADCSDTRYGLPGRFNLVRCNQCDLVYLNPRPTPPSLAAYYPQEYIPHRPQAVPRAGPSLRERIAGNLQKATAQWLYPVGDRDRTLSPLWSFVAPLYYTLLKPSIFPAPWGQKTALEIGCGVGTFLTQLRDNGWIVSGVEPNEQAALYARKVSGLDVFVGELADANFPDNAFQLVALMHVLEHVAMPISLLREISRILIPGGIFLMMLPNIQSLEFRLFGRDWYSLDVPRHLYHFSPKTVRQALALVDLEVCRIVPQPNPYALASSVYHRFEGKSRQAGNRHASPIVHFFGWFTAMTIAHLGLSGDIFVHAVKPNGSTSL